MVTSRKIYKVKTLGRNMTRLDENLFKYTYNRLKNAGIKDEDYYRTYLVMGKIRLFLTKELPVGKSGLFLDYSTGIDFSERVKHIALDNNVSDFNSINWNSHLFNSEGANFSISAGKDPRCLKDYANFSFGDYSAQSGIYCRINRTVPEGSCLSETFPEKRSLLKRIKPISVVDKMIDLYLGVKK